MAFEEFLKKANQPKEVLQKTKSETLELSRLRAEYILKSEDYRRRINSADTLNKKYQLCLELITELTSDNMFYQTNIKILGRKL